MKDSEGSQLKKGDEVTLKGYSDNFIIEALDDINQTAIFRKVGTDEETNYISTKHCTKINMD